MKSREFRLLSLITIFILLFVVNTSTLSAHPGNTASDGCHYCRTNCDRWDVPWNVRHCHGGGVVTPVVTAKPVIYTPRPTIKVYATVAPTLVPNVLGISTEVTPSPTPTPLTMSETGGVLAFLVTVVGLPIWGITKLVGKFKKNKI